MASGVLVDTSAWIEALREDGDAAIREQVRQAVLDGTAHLCDIVRLELWTGARGPRERDMLEGLEKELVTVPSHDAVWSTSRRLARTCRRRGLTVPPTDLLVAACAAEHDLDLLHRDVHFDQIASALRGSPAG